MDNTLLLKSMLLTLNMDGSIRLNVCLKAKRPKIPTVVWRLAPSDWGKEIIRRRRSLLLDFMMVRKEVIGGVLGGIGMDPMICTGKCP